MAEVTPTMTPQPVIPAQADPEQAKRQADHAAKERASAQSDARAAAEKKLDEDAKARHDANVAAGQRQAQSKPTPTQKECDLAKLGLLDHDAKEDDGSGPEVIPNAVRDIVSSDDRAKYKTRG